MVTYSCPKCEKEFSQKQKYDTHMNRVRPCTNKPRNSVETNDDPKPLSGLKFIDLFCGIGGFHIALSDLGAECVLACDIDEKCRDVYENNFGIKPYNDITKLETKDIPAFDILCGGFPCQAFSHAGKQGGFEDTRGTLFRDICRILKDCQPKYFLLENVKNLKGHDGGKTIQVIYKSLQDVGYKTYKEPICLSPHQIGVPQHRERVFILGMRAKEFNDFPAVTPTKTDISSILEPETIHHKELEISKKDIDVLNKWEEFIQHFKKEQIKLPTFPLWTYCWGTKEELTGLPEFKQKFIKNNQTFYDTHKKFLEKWIKEARVLEGFVGARTKFEWQCGVFKEKDSLWNLLFTFRPSGIRVKRTNYSGALVAMAQIVNVGSRKRKLSPREVARLQSFPDSFKIHNSNSVAYKQFGNSVNVNVIKHMVRFLLKM
jgi:DNA (cytosine-5)-methyltransferase 1